ncbi:hypothetical protein C483_14695 [Natrialba hulunbeirensis JCM 10989]|uniref:SHOCT domain-containing protein n=1 Tax=Natrialba hulunbeirensis JCM 10989 TaxID=1227493 RepID=L9ZS68_9EURY|nr:SHOCT domain-containing protein [Natrialba hulunbeirensis]ELY89204.1 hypothetical protein C483_14695 [Natrialba hulunbeirensis JCM 10989]
MSEAQATGRSSQIAVAFLLVALLAAFVALVVIDSSVAVILGIMVLVFGGDLLRDLISALTPPAPTPESGTAVDVEAHASDEPEDALERLRVRYADGDLSDAEFERRLELLLETGSLGDAERYLAGDSADEEFGTDSRHERVRGRSGSRSNTKGHSSSDFERSTE